MTAGAATAATAATAAANGTDADGGGEPSVGEGGVGGDGGASDGGSSGGTAGGARGGGRTVALSPSQAKSQLIARLDLISYIVGNSTLTLDLAQVEALWKSVTRSAQARAEDGKAGSGAETSSDGLSDGSSNGASSTGGAIHWEMMSVCRDVMLGWLSNACDLHTAAVVQRARDRAKSGALSVPKGTPKAAGKSPKSGGAATVSMADLETDDANDDTSLIFGPGGELRVIRKEGRS